MIHTHHKAKRHFGRVCILIRNNILQYYTLSIIDKVYDGILAIALKCKSSGLSIPFIGSYLQSENSKFGRNSLEFFEHIASVLFIELN